MKTEIKLTKAAFERWFVSLNPEHTESRWKSLVEESEKPDRIEAWFIVFPEGWMHRFTNEELAKQYVENENLKNVRVVKLVEEVRP